ncbi:MAG TPA: DUF5655 domain-containing protein [Pirellulales bacterium]|nr:DUF5655 domain-containing protein [Pirellulales bacterium]
MRFGYGLLLFQLVNAVEAADGGEPIDGAGKQKAKYKDKTVSEQLAHASPQLTDLYEALKATLVGFGDDVQVKTLKLYIALKRIKNFASVEVQANQDRLVAYVKVDPDTITLENGFTRDVRAIGHWGTGDLEITLRRIEDLEKSKPLLERSYQGS